jgi:hypothetical protein
MYLLQDGRLVTLSRAKDAAQLLAFTCSYGGAGHAQAHARCQQPTAVLAAAGTSIIMRS